MNFLVGDIGGTNTRLLFAKMNNNVCEEFYEKSYSSTNYSNLIDVINDFLLDFELKHSINSACFAIAGPVENETVTVTNLPWIISAKQLKIDLDTPDIKLVNDFLAVAVGIPELTDNDFIVLQEGESAEKATNPDAAIIGAGTGLGAAHLVYVNNRYQSYTSETGHTGFAPENKLQSELLLWMQKHHSHVSLEMLLSGKGLVNIYNFLHEMKGMKESSSVKDDMTLLDPAKVITEYALSDDDELCQATLDCFIGIYGAAAGNVALNYYPIGDLYIAGGIAVKIKQKMMGKAFIDAFVDKGLLSSNMKKISIKLITQDKVGLYGALAILKSMYL